MGTADVRRRVLVVDDDRLMRWSLNETLSEHGCDVVEAPDAHGALLAINDAVFAPDVVLLDLHLPDSDNLDFLTSIAGRAHTPKIVVMSAFMSADIDREARARGAFDVLAKPFEIDTIVDVVARATH